MWINVTSNLSAVQLEPLHRGRRRQHLTSEMATRGDRTRHSVRTRLQRSSQNDKETDRSWLQTVVWVARFIAGLWHAEGAATASSNGTMCFLPWSLAHRPVDVAAPSVSTSRRDLGDRWPCLSSSLNLHHALFFRPPSDEWKNCLGWMAGDEIASQFRIPVLGRALSLFL